MNDFDNEGNEQDDLWQLLGKAKKNAVSPLFSRNVLREVRLSKELKESQERQPGIFSWLRKRWQLAAACTAAVVLLSVSASHMFIQHKPQTTATMVAQNSETDAGKANDTEVIAHLDELVAYEENSIWLEDSSK